MTPCRVEGCDRPIEVEKRGWCKRHYERWRRHGDPTATKLEWDPLIRLERDVTKTADGCWVYNGADSNQTGHQRWFVGGKRYLVHRWTYEHFVGPIPGGLVIDHLCRQPACCNPEHLEPVTQGENVARADTALPTINARKTHCKRGHEFTDRNTGRRPSGARYCHRCRADAQRERTARLRA